MSFDTASVAGKGVTRVNAAVSTVVHLSVRPTLGICLIAEGLRILPKDVAKGVIGADAKEVLPATTVDDPLHSQWPLLMLA